MSDKALKWRDRASHLRHTADNDKDPEQKAKLIALAEQWEKLAAEADELAERQRIAIKPAPSLRPKEEKRKPTHTLGDAWGRRTSQQGGERQAPRDLAADEAGE
jgi:hypothetical protein